MEKLDYRPVVEQKSQEVQTEALKVSKKLKTDILPETQASQQPRTGGRKTMNFKVFRDQTGEVKAIQFKLC